MSMLHLFISSKGLPTHFGSAGDHIAAVLHLQQCPNSVSNFGLLIDLMAHATQAAQSCS